MPATRLESSLILGMGIALLGACQDGSQAPTARAGPPLESDRPAGSMLEPVDLVYICGNKFLATNNTESAVHVTYRVVGTNETGGLTLREGTQEDPGFSETELETKHPGTVELYRDGERVARWENEGRPCGAPAISASVAGMANAEGGSWTEPFPWPNVGIHLSLLPDGRVLSWGEFRTPQIWDPPTGAFTSVPSPLNLFCSGHAFLADGRLLVSGGHLGRDKGFPDNTIFNLASESWTRSTPMLRGRWYPTNTTLGNGDVVILAGRDQVSERVLEPEVWSPSGVRVLTGAAKAFPYYPRAFLAPNGKLFYAGEQRPSRYLNPSGAGKWETAISSVLYGNREYGAAVMYDVGKILYVGGGRTTNTAEIIDLNSAAPAWQWTGSMAFARRHLNATLLPTGEVLATGGTSGPGFNDIATVAHAAEVWSPVTGTWRTLASNAVDRGYHSTSILLPDGRVLHAGSGDGGGQAGIENAEIFSPPYLFKGPRPTITDAPAAVPYGTSFSLSSPDAEAIAKVSLVRLGSTTHAFDMNQRFQWLSFTQEAGGLTVSGPASRNVTPPGHYMLFVLNGDGVPSVAKIIRVGSGAEPPPPPPPPSSITLTTTGRSDATKHYMTLDWTGATGTNVDVYRNGPFLTATLNDGHYTNSRTFQGAATYTYKVCQTGTTTCSNESTVEIDGGTTPPPNAPPSANFSWTCNGLACAFTDASTDADGTVMGWSWTFGDGASATDRSPAHTYGAAGSYPVTLTATDNGGATGQRSATVTVTDTPASITLSASGRADATTQYMTLLWTGASGTMVDVYRNGPLIKTTENDGRYTNTRQFVGAASYTYKVCQPGTTVCSNEATVVF